MRRLILKSKRISQVACNKLQACANAL